MARNRTQEASSAGRPSPAESLEGRARPEGNAHQGNRLRTQDRERLHQALARIRNVAERDRTAQFTTLWHHVYDVDRLRAAFAAIKAQSAAGIDGVTKRAYEERLEENLADLSVRLQRGAYHALPVKRVYIPKPDGRQRPLGVPALEDKIVQRATAEVLQAIYEPDFHDFSYGFRPGRKQHDALDALVCGIEGRPLNWVLDADIRGFFDNIDHEWLLTFLKHRIADKRVWRHIKKWLQAGVLEDGIIQAADYGTPQGGSISPLLANIYLHYAFDNWANVWRRKEAIGEMLIVRFADDVVDCFEYREDAERFLAAMQERMGRFHLELNMDKTHLLEFGHWATATRKHRGDGKPETFDFLGFTHCCGKTRQGKFVVRRQTAKKKMQAKLQEVRKELRQRLSQPVHQVGEWLGRVLEGHYQYYAVPFNYPKLSAFRHHVKCTWKRALERRSQKGKATWARMDYLSKRYLPQPRILHPFPLQRLRSVTT
jgi:RNA-directed DNA polymerase